MNIIRFYGFFISKIVSETRYIFNDPTDSIGCFVKIKACIKLSVLEVIKIIRRIKFFKIYTKVGQ